MPCVRISSGHVSVPRPWKTRLSSHRRRSAGGPGRRRLVGTRRLSSGCSKQNGLWPVALPVVQALRPMAHVTEIIKQSTAEKVFLQIKIKVKVENNISNVSGEHFEKVVKLSGKMKTYDLVGILIFFVSPSSAPNPKLHCIKTSPNPSLCR